MKPLSPALFMLVPLGLLVPVAPVVLDSQDPVETERVARSNSEESAPSRVFFLRCELTTNGIQWTLAETRSKADTCAERADLFPQPGEATVREWIIATTGNARIPGEVSKASFTLELASVQERSVHLTTGLVLDGEVIGEQEDTLFLLPYVRSPHALVEDVGWERATFSFTVDPSVRNVGNARVMVAFEMGPGSDWRVKMDGTSRLTLT